MDYKGRQGPSSSTGRNLKRGRRENVRDFSGTRRLPRRNKKPINPGGGNFDYRVEPPCCTQGPGQTTYYYTNQGWAGNFQWCISHYVNGCTSGAYPNPNHSCQQCVSNSEYQDMGNTCSRNCICPQHLCDDYDPPPPPPPGGGFHEEATPPARIRRGGRLSRKYNTGGRLSGTRRMNNRMIQRSRITSKSGVQLNNNPNWTQVNSTTWQWNGTGPAPTAHGYYITCRDHDNQVSHQIECHVAHTGGSSYDCPPDMGGWAGSSGACEDFGTQVAVCDGACHGEQVGISPIARAGGPTSNRARARMRNRNTRHSNISSGHISTAQSRDYGPACCQGGGYGTWTCHQIGYGASMECQVENNCTQCGEIPFNYLNSCNTNNSCGGDAGMQGVTFPCVRKTNPDPCCQCVVGSWWMGQGTGCSAGQVCMPVEGSYQPNSCGVCTVIDDIPTVPTQNAPDQTDTQESNEPGRGGRRGGSLRRYRKGGKVRRRR